MFYKMPIDSVLTKTSFRCYKIVENRAYIEYNEGYIGEDWEEIDEATAREIAPEWFHEEVKEPDQLERIESMLKTLTSDTVTAETIEAAILEGVNEV